MGEGEQRREEADGEDGEDGEEEEEEEEGGMRRRGRGKGPTEIPSPQLRARPGGSGSFLPLLFTELAKSVGPSL